MARSRHLTSYVPICLSVTISEANVTHFQKRIETGEMLVDCVDFDGYTLAMCAASAKRLNFLRFLVEHEANLDLDSPPHHVGDTALWHAFAVQSAECAAFLENYLNNVLQQELSDSEKSMKETFLQVVENQPGIKAIYETALARFAAETTASALLLAETRARLSSDPSSTLFGSSSRSRTPSHEESDAEVEEVDLDRPDADETSPLLLHEQTGLRRRNR